MKYPPLSDSLILPPVNDIYIVASYSTQSCEAYRRTGDDYSLIGQLPFGQFINNFNEHEIYNKWLQDVGYTPKRQ